MVTALLRHLAARSALAALVRAAAAPPAAAHSLRPALVSLASFSPPSPARHAHSRGGGGGGGVHVSARTRRNLFLEPARADDEGAAALRELYGSGRFNEDSDEEWDAPPEGAAGVAPAAEDGAASADDGSGGDDGGDDGPGGGRPPSALLGGAGLALPPARHTRVRSAEFIKSSPSVAACPPAVFPEFAVIGRSNVGKSSLVNMLTGRAALAAVSKTPGKTRLINHFLINKAWYLVDLPGYGFARASKDSVAGWNAFTRDYFLARETLVAVLLLVDASIPPVALDLAAARWLGENGVPFSLVFTKADKRKKGLPRPGENAAAFRAALAAEWDEPPPALVTSSRTGAGKAEVLAHVAQLRDAWNKLGARGGGR